MKGKTSAPNRTPVRESRFALVVNAFADDRQVAPPGTGKGFGSGALKVNGKIFAMISSKREFVVKLSEERVNELVTAGKGSRFDPGRGRVMKEWLVVTADHTLWIPVPGERTVSRTPANASTRKYWPSAAKQDAEELRSRTARLDEE
jgi:hypothetical protein